MKKTVFLTCFMLLGMSAAANAYFFEDAVPHDESIAITCEDCHDAPIWGVSAKPYLQNVVIDGREDCKTCHINATGKDYTADSAPEVETHGSDLLGTQFGIWSFECWDCHQNHFPTPVTTPLVEGVITGYSLAGTTNTNLAIDSAQTVVNDPNWALPGEWMQKTAEQSPYDPKTDPDMPEYWNGPCDATGSNYDPDYLCDKGVNPGERGLILYTTYDSGRQAAFEISYATDTQIIVKGRFLAGESFTGTKAFALRYGMNVKQDIPDFGWCTPDPLFCSENTTVACTTDDECPNFANGETCGIATKCVVDDDCPIGSTCTITQVAPDNFTGPHSMADNDGLGGSDPLYDPNDIMTDTGNAVSGLKDSTPDGVCQVCHTKTKYYTASGAGASHKIGQVCSRCHLHTTGFQPSGDCNSCHGYPPDDTEFPSITGSVTAGAHQFHATAAGYNFKCNECHYGGMPASPIPDTNIQIGFDTFAHDNSTAIYYGQQSVADNVTYNYQGTSNGTNVNTQVIPVPPTDPNYLTCKNVYCHSQGKRLIQGFDLPSTSNPWNSADSDIQGDNFECNNCHNYPPTFDSHRFHLVRGYGCELCHAATTPNGYSISDKTKHVNGTYDVEPGSAFYARKTWHNLSFVYDFDPNGGGTCSSNSCHQYWNYKDPKKWNNYPQQISNVSFTYTQDTCAGTVANPAADGTVFIDVTPNCPDCAQPYTCDFDWGDGSQDLGVACNTSHNYADVIPAPYDPTGTVIGAFPVTWTIRDVYQTTLPEGTRTERVEVCPLPNDPPLTNFIVEIGPDPNIYDVVLTDLSSDPDYNLGTHYDPNGIVPGQIWIKWGGFAPGATVKGELIEPIELTDQPSGFQYTFEYSKSGSYYISHGIKDNHGTSDFVWSPTVRFYVSK